MQVYLWLVWRNAAQLRACNRMQSSTYTLGLRFQLAENRRVLAIFRRAVHSMGPLLLVLLMCIGAALAQPDRDGDQLYGVGANGRAWLSIRHNVANPF